MSEANGDIRKRCLLGMPSTGVMSVGAQRTWDKATAGRVKIRKEHAWSSLLTENMNRLFCLALNDARQGEGPEYFAMMHSDLWADDYWLDTLIAEMEGKDLDALGVVIPIKSKQGLTSTALGRLDGDPWAPHARLTLSEVHRLPETFTSDDVGGYPLLVNTGLFVCRFSEEWASKAHFAINDRIVFNEETGEYENQCEPDDWFFSRRLNALGLRIGATRKIAVAHQGYTIFENRHPWGDWTYDQSSVSESPIPLQRGWFPSQVAGWLTEAEGMELAEVANRKTVLEIGSYCGRSTICLAQKATAVYAVDTFDGRATGMVAETLTLFRQNLLRHGVADRVQVLRGTSAAVVPNLPPLFDVVFIDGAHDYESVKTDISLALSVLKPGGLLAFHDYRLTPGEADGRWDPGVTQAVNEILSGGADLLRRVDSLAVVRPAAADIQTVGGCANG